MALTTVSRISSSVVRTIPLIQATSVRKSVTSVSHRSHSVGQVVYTSVATHKISASQKILVASSVNSELTRSISKKSSDHTDTSYTEKFLQKKFPKPEKNKPEVFFLRGSLAQQIQVCESEIKAVFPYALNYGDVIGVRHPLIRTSSLEQLAYDTFYSPPPPIIKTLFQARLWVGQVLGLEKHINLVPDHEIWQGPDQPFEMGKRLFFFQIKSINVSNQEVTVQAETTLVDTWLSLKKKDDCLYFVSCVHPLGVFGNLYWKLIQPFHKVVISSWLKNAGDTFLRSQSQVGKG